MQRTDDISNAPGTDSPKSNALIPVNEQLAPGTDNGTRVYQLICDTAAVSTPLLQSAATYMTDTLAPVAQSAISQAASATYSMAVTAASSATTYMNTPPTAESRSALPAAMSCSQTDTKARRHCTPYTSNLTAAIALPTEPLHSLPAKHHWLWQTAKNAVSYLSPFSTASEAQRAPANTYDHIQSLHEKCTQLEKSDPTNSQLKLIDRLTLEKISLIESLIIEHAERRGDDFFYLCVALHKQNVTVVDGPTIRQHGKGSKKVGTAGCHDSLFSNPQVPVILKSFLIDTLNATMELPEEVNKFDRHLEGLYYQSSHYVKRLLNVLNDVSRGYILTSENQRLPYTPADAMTHYLIVMQDFFDTFKKTCLDTYAKRNELKLSDEIQQIHKKIESFTRIWELQRRGTFKPALPNRTSPKIDPAYVNMMLGAHTTWQATKKLFIEYALPDNYYLDKQKEILSQPALTI